MARARIVDEMMKYTSPDVSREVALVLSIANKLRGAYTADKYKEVIIPMIIIRRFECALMKTKNDVVAAYKNNPNLPSQKLESIAKYKFYNTSPYTLEELLNDADNIVARFGEYIKGFSENVRKILDNLAFEKQIEKMDTHGRLLAVVREFADLDLDPDRIDNTKVGYIFEEIIRKYSENAEAGDHYTPREVIRLLVSIILAEGCDDLYQEHRVATVLDMACGSGGMLSTTFEFLTHLNSQAEVQLFGQEINPESYAICVADMLIKGENARNIVLQDTMKADSFEGQDMRIVIANPPFGQAWGGKDAAEGVEKAVKAENKKGAEGRFPAGLPATSDMQLLFMQHAISKMSKNGRAAIITNGSPLFSGSTSSGESQIRRYMLENDLLDAIIALPSDLFYNTSISIYAFVLSKNKSKERRGKVQLINAVGMFKMLGKSLGKKRKEISREDIGVITELYSDFKESKNCKIFRNEEFMYREYAVYQPLQRTGSLSAESVAALKTSVYFTANGNIFNEAVYEELLEMNPREAKEEKKFREFKAGKTFVEEVIRRLEANTNDTEYNDFASFAAKLKEIIGKVDGMTPSRLNGIAMELSVMDKTAVVQRDRQGEIIVDPATKDNELVGFSIDAEDYFKREVLPHVPDAIWRIEDEGKNAKPKLGAEFPFTRYFYEYKAPASADDLLAQFTEIERGLTERVAVLLGGAE